MRRGACFATICLSACAMRNVWCCPDSGQKPSPVLISHIGGSGGGVLGVSFPVGAPLWGTVS
jgi:hypothetical protein